MKKIDFKKVRTVVCDFDGVLTDNKVYINQHGEETVACSRADGLAFDIFRKLNIPVFIFSTEKNPVVAVRARKLRVPAVYGIDNKLNALKILVKKYKFSLKDVLYIGNDINDYEAMLACGWRACPADAYKQIKRIANIVTEARGGEGVVRELIENFQ